MLFMVVERFRSGDPAEVGQRFREKGRMMPEGVVYHASWMEESGKRCYQIMEAADAEMLKGWTDNWDDLVEFEVVPVMTSAEYWETRRSSP